MILNNLKVLYVEADDEIRNTMVHLLENEVMKIYTAKDLERAFAFYKNEKPDIIITNSKLQNSSGLEFIKKLRKNDHNTKIIILSQESDIGTLISASELKLTKYLLIPIKGDELYDALKNAVEEIKAFSITTYNILQLKDNYTWNFESLVLSHNLKEIHLTPKEKKILNYLLCNPNITVTYDMLEYELWDDCVADGIGTIKTMIKNIRKKLPQDMIKNIYGTGFKYQP